MFLDFLRDQIIYPFAGVLALGIPFALAERLRPERRVSLRDVLPRDLFLCFVALVVGIAVRAALSRGLLRYLHIAAWFDFIPRFRPWCKLPITLVGIDFRLYWIHRAMHTRLLWRTHRWHHSASKLYWFSGFRSSFVHNLAYALNGIVWGLAMRVPRSLFSVGAILGLLFNHWMHTNLRLKSRALEWIMVTPRTHALHHARMELHHQGNYGGFFTVWDRLFGTWVDPDRVAETVDFGNTETTFAPRMWVGL